MHNVNMTFYLLRIVLLALLGASVVGTFALVWSPFLFEWETFVQVVRRMFPFDRGLYEVSAVTVS